MSENFLLEQHIRIRLSHNIISTLNAVQCDTGREFFFIFDDYDVPSDAELRIYIRKPSGHEIYNYAHIANGKVVVQPTLQMLAEKGKSSAQLQIIKNHVELTTFPFYINVEENLIATSSITSTDEFLILDELINNVRTAITKTNELSENIKAEELARANAETARVNSENKRKTEFNTLKSSSETATKNANDAATNANTKATLANSKATLANEAAENAINKADLANTAANNANNKASLANTAASNANTKATLADSKATLADAAATNANDKAALADNAAKEANTAATNANTKATLANTAATNANTKATLANTAASNANSAADRANDASDRAEKFLLGDISGKTVTFQQAAQRANVKSGDSLELAFGKLAKYCADLKDVAFTGSYTDLSNKPTLGTSARCTVVNNFTTTSENTVLDGRAGKTLQDQATELNRNIQNKSSIKSSDDTVWQARIFQATLSFTDGVATRSLTGTLSPVVFVSSVVATVSNVTSAKLVDNVLTVNAYNHLSNSKYNGDMLVNIICFYR